MSDPPKGTTEQHHASCVAVDGAGVLLRGPSGAGKSGLAIRLIDGGGELIADDRVDLRVRDGVVVASAPEALRGSIEVRGFGIVRVSHAAQAPLALVVDLLAAADVPRLPERASVELMGVTLRRLMLDGHAAGAAATVRLVLGLGPDAMVAPT